MKSSNNHPASKENEIVIDLDSDVEMNGEQQKNSIQSNSDSNES